MSSKNYLRRPTCDVTEFWQRRECSHYQCIKSHLYSTDEVLSMQIPTNIFIGSLTHLAPCHIPILNSFFPSKHIFYQKFLSAEQLLDEKWLTVCSSHSCR